MHYGLLLSPIVIRAFRRIQAPGAALCLFLGMLLLLLIIRDACRLWGHPYVGQPCMGISGCCHSRYDCVGMDCKCIHEEAQRY